MCGRFTITALAEDLVNRYKAVLSEDFNYRPNYNVAPLQYIPTIIGSSTGNRLGMLRWGLVPSWAKDDKIGSKMINARSETLTEKPAFRQLINSKRCIIPSNGIYEWKTVNSKKQPMRIVMKDESVFSMAGLYETWTDPNGQKLSTCTIITTEPNSLMAEIHNRMPVILSKEDESIWLGREIDQKVVLELLKPFSADRMRAYKVGIEVGNVRNNNEHLLDEIQ